MYIGTMQHVNWNILPFTLYEIKRSQQHKPQCTSASRMRANHPVDSMMHCEAEGDEAMRWTMRRCYGAMRWGYVTIVHRIASSSIASPHRPSHRPIASPHRPSHRLIVHRIASSSIASPHRPSRRRNASVSLLGHHRLTSVVLHCVGDKGLAHLLVCGSSWPRYHVVQGPYS